MLVKVRIYWKTNTTENQKEGLMYCPETKTLLTHVCVFSQEKAKELQSIK